MSEILLNNGKQLDGNTSRYWSTFCWWDDGGFPPFHSYVCCSLIFFFLHKTYIAYIIEIEVCLSLLTTFLWESDLHSLVEGFWSWDTPFPPASADWIKAGIRIKLNQLTVFLVSAYWNRTLLAVSVHLQWEIHGAAHTSRSQPCMARDREINSTEMQSPEENQRWETETERVSWRVPVPGSSTLGTQLYFL